jgi:hypothetical protein
MGVTAIRAALTGAMVALALAPAAGQTSTVTVNAGESLQAALDRAQPGQTLMLQAGATFEGNFVLPRKTGTAYITVRTATSDAQLPGTETRIALQHEPLLATLRAPNALPALRTAPGAHHWRIVGLRFTGAGAADLISLGDPAQTDRSLVPTDLIFDRVILRGDDMRGQKRGFAMNSASTFVRNSYIGGIRLIGQESQGIACWNGPGPFVIENNYIEAAGIGILFGGAEPALDQLVPSDIVVRRNHITRPTAWREGGWVVKNLFELKNARRVLVEANVLENNWAMGQNGFAVLFTPRAHGTRATWTIVESVRFQNNIVRHVAAGINISGYDSNAVTQQTRDILIRNNLFTDVSHTSWGGNGTFVQIGDEPLDVHVEHNTVLQTGNIISAYGGTPTARRQSRGFRFASNIVLHNTYGIFGDGTGTGNPAIATYFPESVIVGNAIAGGRSTLYPAGNVFPTVDDLMRQFRSPSTGDYRLIDGSNLRSLVQGVTGVDHEELTRALNPTPPRAPGGVRLITAETP